MFSKLNLLQFLFCSCLFLNHLTLAEDRNHFIYHGFNETDLRLNGIAKIDPNGLLELTNISYQQRGHAFFPIPFKFNEPSTNNSQSLSFSTTFVFAIVPEMPTVGGHGFAFTISPSFKFPEAYPVDWLGLFNDENIGLNSNHVFAVEFDTIRTPLFHDIDDNHVGIDVNGLKSNVSARAAYSSGKENKSLQLISGDPIQAWIDYDGEGKLLDVTLAPLSSKKPERCLLSTTIDLSLVLLNSMYVGFSSSTGSIASAHYILGWSFNKSGQAQDLDLSKLPPLPPPKKNRKKPDLAIMLPSVIVSVLLIIVSGYVCILRRKKFEELREDWEKEYGPQRFSYKDLYKATKGFKDKELLGSGGFGRVYRGLLPSSNTQVAIKKFSHDSQQGMKEFIAEIATMGRLRHRNLVQLLGYCRRKGELLLVYDYMPNGSLDKFQFHKESQNLNWVRRYQILKGVASALLYLHEEWEQVVLHRDVKPSNVMLDADLNGRLGDFGLAKFYDHGSIPQTTCVAGTIGYLAPEVSRTGKVTTSSDVFAFGTMMLEVACGRRPVEPERPPQELILVDWVLDCWRKGKILETSDPRLEGKFMEEEMELLLKLGLLCTQPTPAARPIMRQVMQYLEGRAILPELPFNSPGVGFITVNQAAELPINGPGVGFITVNQAANGEYCCLSFPASTEYSGLSITDSILSSAR